MSDESEYQEYLAYLDHIKSVQPKAQPTMAEEPGLAMKALQTGIKGLDYLGGITRTGAANLLEVGTGKNIVTSEDLKNALKGEAPTSAEYLERRGLGEGGSLSDVLPSIYSDSGEGLALQKGGFFDPTARGAAGFVADTVLDPLTYASVGLSVLNKSNKLGKAAKSLRAVLTPGEAATESAGKNVYKSAFKNIDKDLVEAGKAPISDKMLERGFTGNMTQARAENNSIRKEAGRLGESATKKGAELGSTIDPLKSTEEAYGIVQELRKSRHPNSKAAADKLEEIIMGYTSAGKDIPVDVANSWKKELYGMLPKNAYDPVLAGKVSNQAEVEKAIADGLREDIYSSVKAKDPGLADKLKEYNQTYGSSKTAQSSFKREAKKAITKNNITLIDAGLGGGALVESYQDPEKAKLLLALLAGKKIGSAINSTRVRTAAGKGLNKLGTSLYGVPDVVARQGLWHSLKNQENNK